MRVEFTTETRPGPSRAFALIPAAICLLATLNLHVHYFSLSPGPTENVGSLISIEGVETQELSGELLLTTVSLRATGTLAEVIRGWADSSTEVVPRSAIVPPGRSDDEVDRLNVELMQQSQLFAAAAALELLGYEVHVSGAGVQVQRVEPDAPAADVLRRGDIIVAADGQPIHEAAELVRQVDSRSIGDDVHLRILRDGEELEVAVRTIPREEDANKPMIGVRIQTLLGDIQLPISVQIDAGQIGGPSAGLVFALAVYDLVDPQDLMAGRTIAGTGVIGLGGQVGAVGGVKQKVIASRAAGADVFLSPRAIVDSACEVAGDLPVVAIDELRDAVEALRDPELTARGSCR